MGRLVGGIFLWVNRQEAKERSARERERERVIEISLFSSVCRVLNLSRRVERIAAGSLHWRIRNERISCLVLSVSIAILLRLCHRVAIAREILSFSYRGDR